MGASPRRQPAQNGLHPPRARADRGQGWSSSDVGSSVAVEAARSGRLDMGRIWARTAAAEIVVWVQWREAVSSPLKLKPPTEWIELGARVHGAFGAFIPIGIRIDLDAKERIKAEPRGLA